MEPTHSEENKPLISYPQKITGYVIKWKPVIPGAAFQTLEIDDPTVLFWLFPDMRTDVQYEFMIAARSNLGLYSAFIPLKSTVATKKPMMRDFQACIEYSIFEVKP